MIVLVFLIALVLRFWQLASIPPALDWDEVSNAYNGYSILKTGRDEFGQFLPILFQAYDGYVPPVLIYLNSLSIAIFGLNEQTARIPNAFLGFLTIPGIYLLIKTISGNRQLGLVAALLLAISPWHILYSRINVLATTPIFFVVYATYFFFLGLNRLPFLIISSLFFLLAIFSYFSAYVFVPLFAFFLVFVFRRKLNMGRSLILTLPLVISSFLILFVFPGGQNRYMGISIFADPDLLKVAAQEGAGEEIAGKFIHNRRLIYSQEFLTGYFNYLHLDFLFGKGDAVERMKINGPGFGLLLWWDLPFLLLGIYYLIRKRPNGWQVLLAFALLAPISAASSLPRPASTRATLMLVAFVAISAYGFWSFYKKSFLLSRLAIVFLALNLFIFIHQFFNHFPNEKSAEWFYGYRQLFSVLNEKHNAYKKVYFVFKQHDSLDQIHMFLLFYNKVNPKAWQQNGGTRLGCLGTTAQFTYDRYTFVPYSCLAKPFDYRQIGDDDLIITSRMINENYDSRIDYLDGSAAFYMYESKYADEDIVKFTTTN